MLQMEQEQLLRKKKILTEWQKPTKLMHIIVGRKDNIWQEIRL